MRLEIIRYRNYGNKIESDSDFISSINGQNSEYSDEMYFSFFKLNNGKIIYVSFLQTYPLSFDCYYTEVYSFDDDFYYWWGRQQVESDKKLENPTKEEIELVEEFLINDIRKTGAVATNKIDFEPGLSEIWYIEYQVVIYDISQEKINEIGLPEFLNNNTIYKDGNLYVERFIQDDFNYTGYIINPTDEDCEFEIIKRIKEEILDDAWCEPLWEDYLKTNSFSVNIIEKYFPKYYE